MITREQIQSMVDGECSDELRAEMLREIESQPGVWRTLALALLEEQEWSEQISSLGNSNSPSAITPTIQTSLLDTVTTFNGSSRAKPMLSFPTSTVLSRYLFKREGEAPAELSQEFSSAGASLSPKLRSRKPIWDSLPTVVLPVRLNDGLTASGFPWLSALAASLLFFIGVFGGSFLPKLPTLKSDSGNIQSIAGVRNRPERKHVDPSGKGSVLSVNEDTDMRMVVSGPNNETAEIPIYDISAIDHEVFDAREKREVAKINQRLRKEGFELDVRSEYYTGTLNDGRQLIVPVKHVGVKPYGL